MCRTFTDKQVSDLLYATIDMFIEWRDQHGHSEESARFWAVGEMFDGLNADQELAATDPTERLRLQVVCDGSGTVVNYWGTGALDGGYSDPCRCGQCGRVQELP
jgi:hypothetical protein